MEPQKKAKTFWAPKPESLELYDLLTYPIWVFDITEQKMWYANQAACELWNAKDLDELLQREFNDMSESTVIRLQKYLSLFAANQTIDDIWNYYPKGEAVNCLVTSSGILIEGLKRMAMLCEAQPLDKKEKIDILVDFEWFQHLPECVCEYTQDGQLIRQNKEAQALYGSPLDDENTPHISRHFKDKDILFKVLNHNYECQDCILTVQEKINQTHKWSSIKIRMVRNPTNSNKNLVFISQNITELMQLKEEAERRTEDKSNFLACIAHEIRTPFYQMILLMDLINPKDKEGEQNMQLLKTTSSTLLTIINDLLDFTKIENGQMKLNCESFDLCKTLDDILLLIKPQTEEKNITVTKSYIGIKSLYIGDKVRLFQIIYNLISNAIKFTKDKIELEVTIKNEPSVNGNEIDLLRFRVKDNGIGIPKKYQKLIFDKYKQIQAKNHMHTESHINAVYTGTGLGLSISQTLVTLMKGSIGVKSEENLGATFWFEIRLPKVNINKVMENHISNTDKLSKVNIHQINEKKQEIEKFNTKEHKKILICEDNNLIQVILEKMFRKLKLNFEVVFAKNGKEGVEIVRREGSKFCLILMDIQMPQMDGIEATKKIRDLDFSRSKLPIIGLSAGFQTADLLFHIKNGMNDCISKPINMDGLSKVIKHYIT